MSNDEAEGVVETRLNHIDETLEEMRERGNRRNERVWNKLNTMGETVQQHNESTKVSFAKIDGSMSTLKWLIGSGAGAGLIIYAIEKIMGV